MVAPPPSTITTTSTPTTDRPLHPTLSYPLHTGRLGALVSLIASVLFVPHRLSVLIVATDC
ncbi:MAG: hypothetical protein J07HR59_01368 [Halorubrum sp. J07HR59]|nr:MAG: hypothetical protein J07HR59_01368 [Halorubrum sp. J07HR59]